jgi:CSLREA domain-containing protein
VQEEEEEVRPARCLIAAFAASLALAPSSHAAEIPVTTLGDEFGTAPAAGCSLREAAQSANTNAGFGGCPAGEAAAPDHIRLDPGTHVLTRAGVDDSNVNGDIDLLVGDVTIQGLGSGQTTIQNQGGGDRVLHFVSSPTAFIGGIAVQGGAASGNGGGILAAGPMNAFNVSVSDNAASGDGGGIYLGSSSAGLMAALTVSGNDAGGNGGGIASAANPMTISNATISDNDADVDDGLEGAGGLAAISSLTISNSIIDGNRDGSSSSPNVNCGGFFNSAGYNLFGTADCDVSNTTGDTIGSANLLPLAFNGGNSLTHALPAGSAAINTGYPGSGAGTPCSAADQRGVAREGICDRGAYEYRTPPQTNPTPDPGPAPTVKCPKGKKLKKGRCVKKKRKKRRRK